MKKLKRQEVHDLDWEERDHSSCATVKPVWPPVQPHSDTHPSHQELLLSRHGICQPTDNDWWRWGPCSGSRSLYNSRTSATAHCRKLSCSDLSQTGHARRHQQASGIITWLRPPKMISRWVSGSITAQWSLRAAGRPSPDVTWRFHAIVSVHRTKRSTDLRPPSRTTDPPNR